MQLNGSMSEEIRRQFTFESVKKNALDYYLFAILRKKII